MWTSVSRPNSVPVVMRYAFMRVLPDGCWSGPASFHAFAGRYGWTGYRV
jgi:hypothetical protein